MKSPHLAPFILLFVLCVNTLGIAPDSPVTPVNQSSAELVTRSSELSTDRTLPPANTTVQADKHPPTADDLLAQMAQADLPETPQMSEVITQSLEPTFEQPPVAFIPNLGQYADDVEFQTDIGGPATLFFSTDGLSLSIAGVSPFGANQSLMPDNQSSTLTTVHKIRGEN